VNPHNLRKQEKRKKINRENLVRSFTSDLVHSGKWDPSKYLDSMSSQEILNLMRLYLNNRNAVEHILSYARRFKQAVFELEVDDIEAAKATLAVKSVMEE